MAAHANAPRTAEAGDAARLPILRVWIVTPDNLLLPLTRAEVLFVVRNIPHVRRTAPGLRVVALTHPWLTLLPALMLDDESCWRGRNGSLR